MAEGGLSKKSRRPDIKLRKLNMYKDTVVTAMDNMSDYNKNILDFNNEYPEKLSHADIPEYSILLENLKLANSEEERSAVRERMAEMKRERYRKDTENKEFYERQQEVHNRNTLQVVASVAIVAGLVTGAYKFRKPLRKAVMLLLTKNN